MNEKRRTNFNNVAQYLRNIVHFVKKVEVEIEKSIFKNIDEDKCYKEDCNEREIH